MRLKYEGKSLTSVTTPSVPCCAELVKSEVSSSSARVLSVLQSVIVAVGSPNAYIAKLVLSVSGKRVCPACGLSVNCLCPWYIGLDRFGVAICQSHFRHPG